MSSVLVNLSIDGLPDQLRHEKIAVFLSDAHEHLSPKFREDALRMSDKVLTVPVQQQESANLLLVVSGFICEAFDLLQRRVAIHKHFHNPGTFR